MKKITKDLIIAICLIAYVLILALAYTKMNIDRLSKDIQVFAGTFLVLGLLGLEKAYKSDDGKTAITAIELLVMSFYSLSIMHMVALIKCDFINYMFFSAGAIAIYYFIKEIIIFTKQKRDDLKNLSDISEIVKKDEPIKKEAKKRTKEEKIEIKNNNLESKKKKVNKEKLKENKNNKSKTNKEEINTSSSKRKTSKKTNTKKEEKTERNKSEKEIKTKRKKSESKENNQSKKSGQKSKTTSGTKKKSKKEVKEND